MYKIIYNSFNFREPSLKICNKRYKIGLHKEAEATADYLNKIKSEEGKTKLLALFLGAGEWYSSNKNGDYFAEDILREYYPTFKEHGHVYRHHVNKDPQKKYGDIEFVTYNEKMHRVEGIMVLENDKNQDILSRIDRGEDIPVSMACRVSHDICSECGNKSKTLDDYCEHLKYEMNEIRPTGLKVYAINPDPVFFDISIVSRPADVTAYVFKKVARGGNINFNNLSAFLGEKKYSKKSIEKVAKNDILSKLASIEKEVEGVITGKAENGNVSKAISNTKIPDMPERIFDKLRNISFDDKLSFFNDNDVFLTIKDFLGMLGKSSLVEQVKSILPGIFSRLELKDVLDMETPNIGKIDLTNLDIPTEKILTPSTAKDIISFNISKPPKIQIKIQKGDNGGAVSISSISGSLSINKSAELVKEAKILANTYASYKLNYAKKFNDRLLNSLLVTNNYM